MRLFFAPMEGIVDHDVRELMSAVGGIDCCVTEFVRITTTALPPKVYYRYCPEIENQCRTRVGVPVRIQLLGGNPVPLALNAAKLARYGGKAIDLNFGCPAKMVNNNDGGASLLREPERIFEIVRAVRQAVPASVPVSAKIRLGFEDRSAYLDCAQAIYEAGATELTVHARSKADGYKPPAYWDYIGRINEAVPIPVIANGEIWTVEDYWRCREQSGCEDIMIGRGLLAKPDLGLQIKAAVADEAYEAMTWIEVCQLLYQFYLNTKDVYPKKHLGNRVKQWLVYLKRTYPEAVQMFDVIKRQREAKDIEQIFEEALGMADPVRDF